MFLCFSFDFEVYNEIVYLLDNISGCRLQYCHISHCMEQDQSQNPATEKKNVTF